MQEIFPNIYEVLPAKPTPKKYRSFFLQRPQGNLLMPCFSNHSTLDFESIAAHGGLSRQLLGDAHFKSAHCDEVAERFNAPLYCSEVEAADVTPALQQVVTFPYTRHLLEDGVEVIPTPGHRAGGVCYRVTLGDRRYLLVGDFIWHDGARWIPTATKANVKKYAQSLQVLEGIEFDVLLANSIVSNPTFYVEVNRESLAALVADLLKQLP